VAEIITGGFDPPASPVPSAELWTEVVEEAARQ
jgi:hypothetical protein